VLVCERARRPCHEFDIIRTNLELSIILGREEIGVHILTRAEIVHVLLHILNEPGDEEFGEMVGQALERAYPISLRKLSQMDQKLDDIIHRLDLPLCQFSKTTDSTHAKLIVGIGASSRQNALTHLNRSLDGAQHLTICDPYFLKSLRHMSAEEYVSGVERALPQTLKALEIFAKRGVRNKDIADRLNQMFRRKSIRVKIYKTDDVHDRVWIKDSIEAFSVGTSFNGLGNKFAFILPLPLEDVRTFLKELYVRRSELSFSKSV
jgi:hypothetical protein